jgi:hypothetical protein
MDSAFRAKHSVPKPEHALTTRMVFFMARLFQPLPRVHPTVQWLDLTTLEVKLFSPGLVCGFGIQAIAV